MLRRYRMRLLATVWTTCLLASCRGGPGGPPPAASEAAQRMEQESIRRTNELYDAAFLGKRTDEAAMDLEVRLAALLQGELMQTAPRVVELYGGLAGMYFAAHRYGDAESVLRRLLRFSQEARNDTLFQAGVRKTLAVPALRSFANRNQEIKVLEKLLRELEADVDWDQEDQLGARFHVALLDCLGTAYMLDGKGPLALRWYQEARQRGLAAYHNTQVEDRIVKEALTLSCRLFPLSGLVSTYLLLDRLEDALEVGDELVLVAGALAEGRLLPAGHPARQTTEGALKVLGEAYARRQEARIAETGAKLPRTLEERRKYRILQSREARRLETLARERERKGLSRRSPFTTPSPGSGTGEPSEGGPSPGAP